MENVLKDQFFTVFDKMGYENGLFFIKNELLDLDGVTQEQKDSFFVATFDAVDDGNTIFNRALARAAGLYFRGSGQYAREAEYNKVVEYKELMDAVEFIRTQIH